MNPKTHKINVMQLGCQISGSKLAIPHHARSGSMTEIIGLVGGARKSSDFLIIPLHDRYHTGTRGIHQIGVLTWEEEYGDQVTFLDLISIKLRYNVWKLAGFDREVSGL